MPKVLICGVNGFVGKHLARAFVDAGHSVHGIERDGALVPELSGIVTRFIICDLTSRVSVHKLDLKPYSAIVNLAGLANVGASFRNPDLYMEVNVNVLRFIGEEALLQNPNLRLLAISTGAVYEANQLLPLTENSKTTHLTSPYAQSKLAMEEIADQLRRQQLDCVVARPFNHIGPGQGPGFILPDLYSGLLEAIKSNKALTVGNLKTKRDYTDVRDVVNAYVQLASVPKDTLKHTLYNICRGTSRSGEEILEELKKHIPGSEKIPVVVDKKRIRPNDPLELYGSADLLKTDTNWQPKIPITDTVADFVIQQK